MVLKKKVTRREFIRLSTVATAGVVATACAGGAQPQVAEEAPAPAPAEQEAPPAAEEATSKEEMPASKYKEAPMLAELVAAGELPPVDERLPVNPDVIDSLEGIGNYGGTIRRGFSGVSDRWGPTKMQNECLTWYNPDLSIRPTMSESWEVNDDASEWTFNLREGLKWSDGHPLDSDSWQWWFDNILKNKDLTPAPPGNYSTGSPRVLMELESPDSTTIRMKFAHPKPLFGFTVTRSPGTNELAPGHYMAQFHKELTDDPDALAAAVSAAGFETWDQYFFDRSYWYMNPDRPNFGPWIAKNALSEELFLMERNPYFWQVDTSGQQLPYVDKVNHRLFESPEVFDLWITNGEIDFQNRHVSIGKFTLYKESEENGDYNIILGTSASHVAMQMNLSTKNERLRQLFNERDFRIAVSVAVNRDDMNELVWDGLLTPRQYSPLESSPESYPKQANVYLQYDPDMANQLLDGLGLTERDSEGFRLWNDGSGDTVSFVFEGTAQPGTPDEDSAQLVSKYLADVGIKATYKGYERSLYTEHYSANEIEGAFWGGDRTVLPIVAPIIFVGTQPDRPWAPAFGMWKSDPSNPVGEEPPADHFIWKIWDAYDKMLVEPDDAKRQRFFFDILDVWAEELPMVGFLGEQPAPVIVKNGMKGYLPGYPIDDTIEDEHLLNTQTYFYENPEMHT